MSVNKLERLLNLTAVLLATTRPLTAEELRRKVDGYPPAGSAFHRAFERDKDDLRVLGIPLTVERVRATDPPIDGYRIDPGDYYLADPGLEPDELAALHLATLTVRIDGLVDQEAFWKLGGLDPNATALSAPADPSLAGGVVASIPVDPSLVPIFQSIAEGKTITFSYRDEVRRVDPWRLDFHRGRWYLTGFDQVRDDERNFRLDRIDGPVDRTDSDVTVTRPTTDSTGPRQPWELGDETPTTARLWIDASRAEAASRQLGESVVGEVQSDGSMIFAVPVVRYDAFRAFVLGFLEHAELLEPAEWRNDLVTWLSDIVSNQGSAA